MEIFAENGKRTISTVAIFSAMVINRVSSPSGSVSFKGMALPIPRVLSVRGLVAGV